MLSPQSFLFIAIYDNKIDFVELFLNFEDINVNTCDPASFCIPFMIAVEKNYSKIIDLLIKHPQTNRNMRNTDDESALTIAVRNNRSNIIDLLINDERFDPIESRLNCAFEFSCQNLVHSNCFLCCTFISFNSILS